jgi:hypothetical protein
MTNLFFLVGGTTGGFSGLLLPPAAVAVITSAPRRAAHVPHGAASPGRSVPTTGFRRAPLLAAASSFARRMRPSRGRAGLRWTTLRAVESGTAVSDAEQFRTAMVDRLYSRRPAASAAVEAAMRAVGRHLFLPGVPLAEAYSGGAVVTQRDPEGIAVSSASAPGVVAWMLEQLDVQPGHRILEIGAGTG